MQELNATFHEKKKSVVFEGMIITSDTAFFERFGWKKGEETPYAVMEFFDRCYEFALKKIGYKGTDKNVLSAVIHLDKTTPHLQLYYIPVVATSKKKVYEKGADGKVKRNEKGSPIQKKDERGKSVYVEYTGCTVNFKTYKKSYKSKRRIELPREDWAIFENTQEAIIDKQTFDTLQKIRENKRRPTDMGEMSPLSGMLYCADCGKKMYLCRCTTMKQAEYFNCSTYRKQKKRICGSHQITVKAVTAIIQDDLKVPYGLPRTTGKHFYRPYRRTSKRKQRRNSKRANEK